MPTPKLPEGFYWVRSKSADEPEPFVAHRFADSWFVAGEELPRDGRELVVLSVRLTPPQRARHQASAPDRRTTTR